MLYRRNSTSTVCMAAAWLFAALAPAGAEPLKGYVDMHTHPMSHLAFGGKLIHGAPGTMTLIPTDSSCRNGLRAININHALDIDKATHGGWDAIHNPCGDQIRHEVIKTMEKELHAYQGQEGVMPGAPLFPFWPRWDDITHQKMWVDWVRRAHKYGLNVMVALATNNQTLAASVSGPGDGPGDDRASGDLQIAEIRQWVQLNGNFMEIAYTPADLRRIVGAGKLAVVLGIELDNFGNFNKVPNLTNSMIEGELRRLHGLGVRYIFPIHVIDNKFGGTAVYADLFNLSNYREFGSFWDLECSRPEDHIGYKFVPAGFDVAFELVKVTKLGIPPTVHPPTPPACAAGTGHVNRRGLTNAGEFALKTMMRLGMLIDIDHMSQRTANDALRIADETDPAPGRGYPLNAGHSGFRSARVANNSENSRSAEQLDKIEALRGLVGVGTEAATAEKFYDNYMDVASRMSNRNTAIGTDLNGLVRGPQPGPDFRYEADLPMGTTGPRQWDYRREGVAHYGLLPEFVRHVKQKAGANGVVFEQVLNTSAEDFAQMWEQAEARKGRIP